MRSSASRQKRIFSYEEAAILLPEVRRLTEGALRRLEALGARFTEEGLLRDWLCVAGEFRSIVMYSLLRTEWMTRLEALHYRNVDISKFYPYGDPRPFQQRSRPC